MHNGVHACALCPHAEPCGRNETYCPWKSLDALISYGKQTHCAEDRCFLNQSGKCFAELYELCGAWKGGADHA